MYTLSMVQMDGSYQRKVSITKKVVITFDTPGMYLYQCTPHAGMGMIALVVVGGDTSNLDDIAKTRVRGKSKKKLKKITRRMEKIIIMKKVNYKYNEDKALSELKKYIDATYDEHYSKNKFQATEFIIDGGHGEGFCIGNILKYAQRYGKKNGKDRSDLLKVIHYGIIALYINETEGDK